MTTMNPEGPGWDSEELQVRSDSALVAKYRRLQSWYREVHIGVKPGPSHGRLVGSSVPVGCHPAVNFLTPGAWAHAEQRMHDVPHEGGTLDPDRLRRNLLSSMPMCFNIFGSLQAQAGFAGLVAALFDPEAASVEGVTCEWAPPKAAHLNDRSAFDAIVRYSTTSGESRFLGVETKYTEPLSQPKYVNPRYQEVTESCGWFIPGAFEALCSSPAKQLWRTVMLAAAYAATSGIVARAVLISLAEDAKAAAAAEQVRAQMTDPDRLVHVTLENLVHAAAKNSDPVVQVWADRFGDRYLHPGRLDTLPHPE
jgi:hypothetical protein